MKHGDLIVTKKFVNNNGLTNARVAVVLNVTLRDMEQGADVLTPGLYAFHGLWYGDDPLDIRSFGKCYEACGRVVGRIHDKNTFITRLLK